MRESCSRAIRPSSFTRRFAATWPENAHRTRYPRPPDVLEFTTENFQRTPDSNLSLLATPAPGTNWNRMLLTLSRIIRITRFSTCTCRYANGPYCVRLQRYQDNTGGECVELYNRARVSLKESDYVALRGRGKYRRLRRRRRRRDRFLFKRMRKQCACTRAVCTRASILIYLISLSRFYVYSCSICFHSCVYVFYRV